MLKKITLTLLLIFSFCSIWAQASFDWVKSIDDQNYDYPGSMTLDPFGNIYKVGLFTSTVDFDPGTGVTNLSSGTSNSIYIQKLDANGNFVWAKSFG